MHEVCEMEVKIADLGNACWTVSAAPARREGGHWTGEWGGVEMLPS